MKNKLNIHGERNWFLVFVGLILILIGLTLLVFSILYIREFDWWSLPIGMTGSTAIVAAVMSITTNDPSWLLLDLILP